MKAFANLIIIIAIIAAIAVMTKPSDTRCRSEIVNSVAGTGMVANLVNNTGLSSYALDVQDYGVYKTITSRIDGRKMGIGLFTTVIITR